MSLSINALRRRAAAACAAALALAATSAHAVTVKVGPSAGLPDSNCQFDSVQAAIDSLPEDNAQHVIELEARDYLDDSATFVVAGRSVRVATRYEQFSGCTLPTTTREQADLRASQTSIEGGRTVVVRNGGKLILEAVRVLGNASGAIRVRDSELTLIDSMISGNSTPAGVPGAGVEMAGGYLLVEDTVFRNNMATTNGGAVFCSGGSVETSSTVVVRSQSRFTRNGANYGGGIYQNGDCYLHIGGDALFSENVAAVDGGAIASNLDVGEENRNFLNLGGNAGFSENIAQRDGGAISLAGAIRLSTPTTSTIPPITFEGNQAGRFGGAIVVNTSASSNLGSARFLHNEALERGGAISVRSGSLELNAVCASGNTVNENYCALFDGNEVLNDGSPLRSGGTLDVRGGDLHVDGYAFRNSQGLVTASPGSGGIIGFVDSGNLTIANSLVYDSPLLAGPNQHFFQLDGGVTLFSFNTMVDLPVGAVISSRAAATVDLVGNIISGNSAGVIGSGTMTGACNNIQIGTGEAPLDPGFVTTSGGRYRLAEDSPMIDLALGCRDDALPPGYIFPTRDLDGNQRIEDGEQEREMDLGAFEFHPDTDTIFASGFEFDPAP